MVHVTLLCSYSIMVCVISAFDVQCPHSSHRQILAKVFCNVSEISKYSCFYDINNHVYTESCNRLPDFVRPGKRYVFMGSRTGIDCSSERYQPFKFWSNELSDCVYEKSLCNEIGQNTYQNRSTKEDNTCSCDYTKGYGFVTQPKHIQYCIPSKEDCSCYLVQCADNNTLSSDYKCKPGLKEKNGNNSTENMDTRDIKPSISDEDDGMVVGGIYIITILIICYTVMVSMIVIKISTAISARPQSEQQNVNIIAENRSFLIEEIHTMTLVKEFQERGILIFDALNGIQSRKQMAEDFCTILENNSNLLYMFLEILAERGMTYVLGSLKKWIKAYLPDTAKLALETDTVPSRISASLDKPLGQLEQQTCTAILPPATLPPGVSALQNKAQTQSEEQKTESVQHRMNETIIAANRSILIEEINIMALVRAFQDKGRTFFDSLDGTLGRQPMGEKFLTILEENNFLLGQLFDILNEQGMPFVLDRLQNCRKVYSADTKILRRNSCNKHILDESSSESDLLYDASFEVSKSDDNSGVPLFPVDKRDICHDQMNLMTQDDTVASLEKCSTGSNYQLQSNDLSDDSRTGLMHDKSEDLENVIQDNNPKIKSEHVKCVSKVNQTISDGMKIPEQVPKTDENLTDMSDTEAIDLTPSISQPLLRSNSQSHCLKRQFSKSELLPKISIKTLDSYIKHVRERRVITDSEGNLQLFVPPGQTVGSSENSEDNNIRYIPAYSSDEINKGACSNIKITDIIAKNMTDKAWKDLCQHEAEKGSELTLEQLPQVCAPDTILLLDISGGMKDSGYKELKDAAVEFVKKRIDTRTELNLNENIAMVTYGHMTEVRHHLTSDYDIVLKHLENLPEPGGPSPMIAGLQLCQSVIAARGKISTIGGRQIGGRHVGGSRFHPRIVLISDGHLTPSECIIGNTNLSDLNTQDKKEETLMIEKLYDICRELSDSKTQVVCIPVGCFNKVRLECIANVTGGKIVHHSKAASLGNERLKMVYAKQIEEGQMSEDDLKSKLLSMRTITADDFDDIIDISKNPGKYGIINDDDDVDEYDDELLYLLSLFE